MNPIPNRIEPASPTTLRVVWNNGEVFQLSYIDLRYHCPCAGCVDEHTGRRTLQRESIAPDIRPLEVKLVGQYALQFNWSDRHHTGMLHFDTLYKICQSHTQKHACQNSGAKESSHAHP